MVQVRHFALVMGVLLGGCLGPQSTECSWGMVCPAGRDCHEPTRECVNPELREACQDLEELDPCSFSGAGEGSFCRSGLCFSPVCGDELIHAPEQCDGSDLDGTTCESFNFNGGTLACSDNCTFDMSGCVGDCGDGMINGQEACDGTNLGGTTCDTLGYYGGNIACTAVCQLDTVGCSGRCGDGIRNQSEACDGEDLGSQTCDTLGYYGGEVVCTSYCALDISGCFTEQAIDVCVLESLDFFPWNHCETGGQGLPVIDWGVVPYDAVVSGLLAIYPAGSGHALLDDVYVTISTPNPPLLALFSVEAFRIASDGETEVPTTFPTYVTGVGDTEILFVRVLFDADFQGQLIDVFLTIDAPSDPPPQFISMTGVISGCPQDYWDINGDPSDGCEYNCEFLSSTESCQTPGQDDNCNGDIDEENADNCTVYYRDHDGDTFGDGNDSRCLCAADGEYNVGQGGDCDDDDQSVRPGVAERCITPYDDNCDGSDNDPGAQGCVSFLRDEDGDGFGITGDTECLCYNAGLYTTSTGGDCDDDPSACGAGCNPGMAEQCSTAYDDNCDGNNNEPNAPGCTTYYRDGDGDGYGHQSLSQCRCYPNGDYDSTDPIDCNDSDNAINPSATEICDTIDNNCVGGIDEGFDLQMDMQNCGSCNHVCVNPHGTTVCVGGVCDPTCSAGWGNCDEIGDNGCERDLSTVSFCGPCSIQADCPTGFFCNVNICEKKWNDGHICSDDVECTTNLCRDGVCCNSDCSGLCRSCSILGSLGTCSFSDASSDPESECSLDPQSSCGQTGMCDGGGGCQLYSAGSECVAESCTGISHLFADTCNGSGGCQDNGSEDCSPFFCSGTTCRTSCTLTSHCVAGFFCTGNACVPLIGLGDPCNADAECSSGHCEDSVCCNRECGGTCRACNLAGNVGTCIDHATGQDPEAGCGLCRVCDGSGSCATASNGTDPKNDCSQQSQESCGWDGMCDGGGACRNWASGTVCLPQSCGSHVVTLPWTCNVSGICLGNGSDDCTPYECVGSVCGSSCGGDGDCIAGYWCNGGACVPI